MLVFGYRVVIESRTVMNQEVTRDIRLGRCAISSHGYVKFPHTQDHLHGLTTMGVLQAKELMYIPRSKTLH